MGSTSSPPHNDVLDDEALRLVILPPENCYSREEPRIANEGVLEFVRNNGAKPRYRGNRLLFLAPDHGVLTRLGDCIRAALAWNSIFEDVSVMRLVLDNLQCDQCGLCAGEIHPAWASFHAASVMGAATDGGGTGGHLCTVGQ